MYKLMDGSSVLIESNYPIVYDPQNRGWKVVPHTLYADTNKAYNVTSCVVPVVAFRMRFSAAERIKLQSLRATDAQIEDLFKLLEDPKTDAVLVDNPTVMDGVPYCIGQCKTDLGYTDEQVTARVAAILENEPVLS